MVSTWYFLVIGTILFVYGVIFVGILVSWVKNK